MPFAHIKFVPFAHIKFVLSMSITLDYTGTNFASERFEKSFTLIRHIYLMVMKIPLLQKW